jgi:uncharacterized glyoxalase superfamily protein PhnB
MKFIGTCILTNDVARLRDFYVSAFQTTSEGDDVFSTINIEGAVLSICTTNIVEEMAPNSMNGAGSGNITLEFEVNDVDGIYEKLKKDGVEIVKKPTTQSWGNRSAWIRDPDGNLINLFCKVNK